MKLLPGLSPLRGAALSLVLLAAYTPGAFSQESGGPLRYVRPGEPVPPAAIPGEASGEAEPGESEPVEDAAPDVPGEAPLRFGAPDRDAGLTEPADADAIVEAAPEAELEEEPQAAATGQAADMPRPDTEPQPDIVEAPAEPDQPEADPDAAAAVETPAAPDKPVADTDAAAAAEMPENLVEDGEEITGATPDVSSGISGPPVVDDVERIVEPETGPTDGRIRATLQPDATAPLETPDLPKRPALPEAGPNAVEPLDRTVRLGIVQPALGRVTGTQKIPEALSPLGRDFTIALGRPVEFVVHPSYRALVDAQVAGRIDGGFFSSAAYAAAETRCKCLVPLVAPAAADGTTAYRSILVARAGSGIRSLADLAGRKVAVGPQEALATRLVPFAELARSGKNPTSFFGETIETASPLDAVRMMREGEVDAAFAWASIEANEEEGFSRGTLADLVRYELADISNIVVAWQSAPISHGPVAVVDRFSEAEMKALREVLEDLDPRSEDRLYDILDPLYGGGMKPVAASDYRAVASVVEPSETR